MSVHQAILDKINSKTPGDIFFPAEFRMLGTDDAIKMALSRLVKENTIERLANGVYFIPQFHHLIGRIKPSLEMIANAIASRDHIQIKPTGMSALNKLGLSEQVPTRHVYITNGQPRTYHVAENEIHFKSASPKKLALKGPISSLIILAMDEMGQSEFDETLASKIKGLLKKEDAMLLENDMMLAPSWIAKELYSIISKFPADEMV
ncbi:DUF6088 family protein [Aquirufa sp. HETE-83D]|uniref:DUF6088 family protein n=1 Tax=Aquirufa esocilacus TaxID=3096513 RepID=A0ABW6DI03_9BACT